MTTEGGGRRELVLSYERGQWRARGAGLDVAHADLAALDTLIVRAFEGAEPSSVHVRFDMGALPAWLRQYQAHYFNYVLRVGRGTGTHDGREARP
ncbi:MAG TPA: DUF5395 family protein [Gammaproteobacteria bacterium]